MQLQSPAYNNAGTGRRLYLPVITDAEALESMAEVYTLFAGDNRILDLAMVNSVVQIAGIFSDGFATEHSHTNALFMRDELRRTRRADPVLATPWCLEAASGNWGTATLPAAEQDASTTRKRGRMRLIYDKRWDTGAGALVNEFLYGTVGRLRIGPRTGASGRYRIPYAFDFLIGTPDTGVD